MSTTPDQQEANSLTSIITSINSDTDEYYPATSTESGIVIAGDDETDTESGFEILSEVNEIDDDTIDKARKIVPQLEAAWQRVVNALTLYEAQPNNSELLLVIAQFSQDYADVLSKENIETDHGLRAETIRQLLAIAFPRLRDDTLESLYTVMTAYGKYEYISPKNFMSKKNKKMKYHEIFYPPKQQYDIRFISESQVSLILRGIADSECEEDIYYVVWNEKEQNLSHQTQAVEAHDSEKSQVNHWKIVKYIAKTKTCESLDFIQTLGSDFSSQFGATRLADIVMNDDTRAYYEGEVASIMASTNNDNRTMATGLKYGDFNVFYRGGVQFMNIIMTTITSEKQNEIFDNIATGKCSNNEYTTAIVEDYISQLIQRLSIANEDAIFFQIDNSIKEFCQYLCEHCDPTIFDSEKNREAILILIEEVSFLVRNRQGVSGEMAGDCLDQHPAYQAAMFAAVALSVECSKNSTTKKIINRYIAQLPSDVVDVATIVSERVKARQCDSDTIGSLVRDELRQLDVSLRPSWQTKPNFSQKSYKQLSDELIGSPEAILTTEKLKAENSKKIAMATKLLNFFRQLLGLGNQEKLSDSIEKLREGRQSSGQSINMKEFVDQQFGFFSHFDTVVENSTVLANSRHNNRGSYQSTDDELGGINDNNRGSNDQLCYMASRPRPCSTA